jgi:hypothetical protein
MAGEYAINYEYFRGTIEDAIAAAEVYVETLDSTNDAIISIDVVGDNNFITICVAHNQS